ncbi:hypothetical protein F5890DRAFT_1622251 [Lentinula detonsa]|uniref:Uncharacterized protein n=1 Tax=Lentinula detonsa TaxID=2804962 RepID=A0AA38UP40_9AGAR|nr:hypothetical protein F5890DRAFT_1622251 [Lentinula detonsa]
MRSSTSEPTDIPNAAMSPAVATIWEGHIAHFPALLTPSDSLAVASTGSSRLLHPSKERKQRMSLKTDNKSQPAALRMDVDRVQQPIFLLILGLCRPCVEADRGTVVDIPQPPSYAYGSRAPASCTPPYILPPPPVASNPYITLTTASQHPSATANTPGSRSDAMGSFTVATFPIA